jgi:hypothetical protein
MDRPSALTAFYSSPSSKDGRENATQISVFYFSFSETPLYSYLTGKQLNIN